MPFRRRRLLFALAALAVAARLPAQPATAAIPSEIVIDQRCRVVTVDLRNPARPKAHFHYDPTLCHLEGVKTSYGWRKVVVNGKWKNDRFEVDEREFVLQNPYPQPVTFLVKQPLAKNFEVDSDPRPSDITDSVATFRVHVQAGGNVRLHVGERD